MKHFIEVQGCTVEHNILHQDNQSSMRLLSNGPLTSSKQTKHIKAKFFLTKDKIKDGDVELEYCPTELMWIDVHTKPKQGTPFRLNRSMLMNIPVEYNDEEEKRKTNPLLLPNTEEPQLKPHPEIEAGYSAIKKPLNHRGSVLQDSTNCLRTPASKAKDRANSTKLKRKLTWADVARGNPVRTPVPT